MSQRSLASSCGVLLLAAVISSFTPGPASAQDADKETGEIALQKTAAVREYNGRTVEGQELVVHPGDTLWRILIQERRLEEKRFGQYVNLVRRLNPDMRTANVLSVGQKVFIPSRPDEALNQPASPVAPKFAPENPQAMTAKEYTVKPGDFLARILREQFGITDDKKVLLYFALTKELNPQRKNWDLLQAGEVIRLPGAEEVSVARNAPRTPAPEQKTRQGSPQAPAPVGDASVKPTEPKKAATPTPPAESGKEVSVAQNAPRTPATEQKTTPAIPQAPLATRADGPGKAVEAKMPAAPLPPSDYGKQMAKENVALITEIIESVGNEVDGSGEEVVPIRDGSLKLNRTSFPVVTNPKIGQKVLLDPEAKVPESVKSQMNDRPNGVSVMTIGKNNSVTQLLGQVFSRLGFQSLPSEQAVVIQEGGVAFEAKGQWVVLGPEENNKPQQVYVINVTDRAGSVPEYLKSYLAVKGLHLREVLWPPTSGATVTPDDPRDKSWIIGARVLPRDKREMVDALLNAYGIRFETRVPLTWELGAGLRIETACERVFEFGGRRTALFFQGVGADMKKSLQEKQSIKTIDLDLATLSSREIVAKLLSELGEQTSYREQRFAAAGGIMRDRLTVVTAGFLLPNKSTLITDRDIPLEFQRFFFEKGWEIVYFQ